MLKAISYLESRCQVFQNVILDNNLVVRDDGHDPSTVFMADIEALNKSANISKSNNVDFKEESISTMTCEELRYGFADPQYSTYLSKYVQTELTTAKLDSSNEEFCDLKLKLKVFIFYFFKL